MVRIIVCVCVLSVFPGLAADPAALRPAIRQTAEQELGSLVELYKHLHRNPEVSLKEEATSARIAKELSAAGYAVTTNLAGFGVVGLLKNGSGPTVLIRTDLDGLPVEEKTGLPYTSEKPGVMHACGHDMHMTSFIGTARTLAKLKDRWRGTVIMVGQPAEETVGGAKQMIASGLYTKFPRPDYCLAMHVDAGLPSGQIGYREGALWANVDSVDITVRGVGGHGAYPHKTKDPVVVASQLIVALQTIVSREVRPLDSAVVTVGQIHGGTKRNIVPDQVDLQLTVRTYSDEVRNQVLDAIRRITMGVAMAAGIPADREPIVKVKEDESTPAVYNNPELTRRGTDAIRAVLGADKVVERDPEMGGEDFGLFGKVQPPIPTFMFRLGIVDAKRWTASQQPGAVQLPGLHSSGFWPEPEPSILTGVQAMTAAALRLLN